MLPPRRDLSPGEAVFFNYERVDMKANTMFFGSSILTWILYIVLIVWAITYFRLAL
jgi:hypothetical protein